MAEVLGTWAAPCPSGAAPAHGSSMLFRTISSNANSAKSSMLTHQSISRNCFSYNSQSCMLASLFIPSQDSVGNDDSKTSGSHLRLQGPTGATWCLKSKQAGISSVK